MVEARREVPCIVGFCLSDLTVLCLAIFPDQPSEQSSDCLRHDTSELWEWPEEPKLERSLSRCTSRESGAAKPRFDSLAPARLAFQAAFGSLSHASKHSIHRTFCLKPTAFLPQ